MAWYRGNKLLNLWLWTQNLGRAGIFQYIYLVYLAYLEYVWKYCQNIDPAHCAPQTILEKQGELHTFFGGILGMSFCSSNSLLKLKNNALLSQWHLFCNLFVWFLLWFCKYVVVKRLPQNIQLPKILKPLFFLGSKCKIITQLGHQGKNKPWNFFFSSTCFSKIVCGAQCVLNVLLYRTSGHADF